MAIRVQMFWPDDKKWYLIQIDSVDPRSRKAQCVPGLRHDSRPPHRGSASQICCFRGRLGVRVAL